MLLQWLGGLHFCLCCSSHALHSGKRGWQGGGAAGRETGRLGCCRMPTALHGWLYALLLGGSGDM